MTSTLGNILSLTMIPVAATIMGGISMDLPMIFMPAGPMMRADGQRAASSANAVSTSPGARCGQG